MIKIIAKWKDLFGPPMKKGGEVKANLLKLTKKERELNLIVLVAYKRPQLLQHY